MYEFIFLLWIHAWIHFFIWKCIYNFKWFYFTPYFPNMNSLWINFSYNYHIFESILLHYEFIQFCYEFMHEFISLFENVYIFKWFYFTPYFHNMNSLWINFSYNYHIFEFILSQYEFIPFHLWIHTISFMNSYNFIYEFIQFNLLWIHTISFRDPYKHYYEFIHFHLWIHNEKKSIPYIWIHTLYSWIYNIMNSYIFIHFHTFTYISHPCTQFTSILCTCVSMCVIMYHVLEVRGAL